MRIAYQTAIERLGVLDKLSSFDPVVIGTPPLGIAVDDSDIDIACSADDLDNFAAAASDCYNEFRGFHVYQAMLQLEHKSDRELLALS